MPSARVHVGQASLLGGLPRYARVFDFLEVRSDPALPSKKALYRMKQEAPEGFTFSLVLDKALSELSVEPTPERVAKLREAAEILGARFILVRTPASVAPSTRTRARLTRLVEALRGAAKSIAWEPRGIWSEEEMLLLSNELELVVVRDLAENDPLPSDVVYTRLLALGRNSRVGSGAIERVSERIEDADEAFVIIEGQGAVNAAKRLKSAGVLEEELEGDDDEESDEDDSDETGVSEAGDAADTAAGSNEADAADADDDDAEDDEESDDDDAEDDEESDDDDAEDDEESDDEEEDEEPKRSSEDA
jgi:uncharacterized protein YecE (DUF72 family)